MALNDLVPLTPMTSNGDAGAADSTTNGATSPASGSTRGGSSANGSVLRVVPCRQTASTRQLNALLAFLAIAMAFAVYSLFSFWPRPTPNEQVPKDSTSVAAAAHARPVLPSDGCDAPRVANMLSSVTSDSLRAQMIGVCYMGQARVIWKETQLVLLVLFAGAVGAVLSCMRKATLHFYKGDLCAEGLAGLYAWPFSGALTALVFYAFIRGGFFSGQSSIAQTSPYMFIAVGLVAGMFTHEAVAKLRQLAETVLTAVDSRPTVPSIDTAPDAADSMRADAGERGAMPPVNQPTASPPGTVG